MGFRKPKIIPVILAALWALCILHGFADSVSAHWHLQESGKVHHHHHPLNGTQEHDKGEPVGERSHDSGSADCCEFKARLSAFSSVDRDLLDQVQGVDTASFILSRNSTLLQTDILGFKAHSAVGGSIFADLSQHVRALRVPNAPPASVAS